MKLSRISVTCGALALVLTTPALAQKLAPTRDYSAYSDTPRQKPDRQFGMPAFGRPALPDQKPISPKDSGPAGSSAAVEPTFPDAQQGGGAPPGAAGGATASTGAPRDPLEDPGANDFFAPSSDFGLKTHAPGESSSTTDLYTTRDRTAATPQGQAGDSTAAPGAAANDDN